MWTVKVSPSVWMYLSEKNSLVTLVIDRMRQMSRTFVEVNGAMIIRARVRDTSVGSVRVQV